MGYREMKQLGLRWSKFLRDESGQDLIEYALVAALVGLGAVATLKGLDTKIANAFGTIGTSLTSNT
jgi:pilus assembly protein Flp/PilA